MYYVKMVTYSKMVYAGIEVDENDKSVNPINELDNMPLDGEYEQMDVSDIEYREYESFDAFENEPSEYKLI